MKDETDYAGFAAGTKVPVERSRAEIDSLLVKNGATSIGILHDTEQNRAAFAFTLKGARYRVEVPLPKLEDFWPELERDKPRGWYGWNPEERMSWAKNKLDQTLNRFMPGMFSATAISHLSAVGRETPYIVETVPLECRPPFMSVPTRSSTMTAVHDLILKVKALLGK